MLLTIFEFVARTNQGWHRPRWDGLRNDLTELSRCYVLNAEALFAMPLNILSWRLDANSRFYPPHFHGVS